MAAGDNQMVMSPRQTSARSEAAQFCTWYFALYVGWTLDFIHPVWSAPSQPHSGLSSSPGGLLPRGPHQNRTRRFPPSGSSADVAHGDAPQIRTRIRGTRSTTFRISGDMSPDVNAPVLGPFESSHQHGPPLLGRVRGPTRSPTSSLVCSPPTPSLPSAAAPVVPGRWPTLSLCDKEEEGPPQVPGPSSSSVP